MYGLPVLPLTALPAPKAVSWCTPLAQLNFVTNIKPQVLSRGIMMKRVFYSVAWLGMGIVSVMVCIAGNLHPVDKS
jgi:hypothetical protein